MGIIKNIDEYGFNSIEVITKDGGRVSITDFGKDQNNDIGFFTSKNEFGLGYSEYIRDISKIEQFINDVNATVWLEDLEKSELILFLNTLRE